MRALEPRGELGEAPLGEGGVGEGVRRGEGPVKARSLGLRQMLQHVASLWTRHRWNHAERPRITFRNPVAPSMMNRGGRVEVEAAPAHIGQQGLAHRRVLHGAFAQAKTRLVPCGSTPTASRMTGG